MDRGLAAEALRLAKRLEAEPHHGDRLREKSNLKPLTRADCRKVKFDRADRGNTAAPRYRYRLVYRIEPHEGSPETVVIMAVGVKPQVYREATARAARRLRDEARARVRRPRS